MPRVLARCLSAAFVVLFAALVLLGSAPALAHENGAHAGRAEAFRLWSRTAGTTDVVHVYLDSPNAARAVTVGLYSNARGRPGVLLSTGSGTGLSTHAWSAVAIAPVRLLAGRTYWLAVLGEGGSSRRSGPGRGPCLSSVSAATHQRRLPRWWRTRGMRTRTHCPIAAYLLAGGAVGLLDPSGHGPDATTAPTLPASASSSSSSSAVAPNPEGPPAPADTVSPAISGPVIVGEQLSASPGTWTGSPTSYTYQWESCNALGEGCLSVSGATASSYMLTPSDLESTVRVVVTASNTDGSTTATSSPAGPVVPAAPTNEAPPAIDGTAEAGETLSASPGTWMGSPTAYVYQWEDCNSAGEECEEVSGATSSTYALTASDVEHTVLVVVTASNAGGATQASSSPTATVAAEQTAPTNEVPPSIGGSTLVGEKLTANPGRWTGHPTPPFAYQWEDCNAAGKECSEIAGAKSQTYTLTASYVGYTIRVVVTASNATGPTPASSEATAVVVAQAPAAPANTALPAISGSAVEGQTLSASHGTWSGSPTSYVYQWEDCNAAGNTCSEIVGATSSSHKLTGSDVGHTLRVVVEAGNSGGTGKATSAATGKVLPPAPADTVAPAISGSTVEGETLRTGTGTWTGSPTSYAYQWEDCNTKGEACANVNGATASNYVLGSSDVEHTLRVVVTASNAGGHSAATSAATKVVTTKEKVKEEKVKEGTPESCFENPETEGSNRFEACGYPGPKNTGVEGNSGGTECLALPEYTGSRSIGTAKTTIEGKLVKIDLGSSESGFDVNAADVTFNKDCLLVSGDGQEGPVIDQEEDGPDLLVENSTIRAEGPKLPYSYEKAVDNSHGISSGWKIDNSRVEDCGECVSGFGEMVKSYVISNEYIGEESHGLHREDWYLNDESAVVKESTMFNPSDQTSDIFMDSNNGSGGIACDDKLTVEGSLLAGGGTEIEMCGKNDTAGSSSFTFTNNRIPRCETKPIVKNSGGEEDCSGPDFEGGDAHGYMPNGGADGVAAFEDTGDVTWSGNYWDDDLDALAKP